MHSRYPEFSTEEDLSYVYTSVMDILPKLVWLGHSVDRRYEECAKLRKLVGDAVSFALSSGNPILAIDWLEAGRSLVWSQLQSLRAPLDELKYYHPELANSLNDVQQQLQCSALSVRETHRSLAGQ